MKLPHYLILLLANSWAHHLFIFFRRLGGTGLLLLGILDSSFLFLPFGNDLLLIALVSADRGTLKWILYVIMSAVGSLIGVLLIDLVMRKAGEEGLEKFVTPNQIKRFKPKVEKKAGRAVFVSTLMPPPFPFTAVVLTASALQCSRKKLLSTVFAGRLLRFTIEAVLALSFGRRIIKYIHANLLEYVVYGILAVAIVGSILSVRKWLRRRQAKSSKGPVPATD
jgi:membrane protein YqaA with SNARE-associated domain